ncbi:ABC transporter permease [Demequina oxidasica]|uniref:ABC transporter permease n=1 Tax=Demequina oxidasica TaxID=676199 RepID=UPI0007805321|nr:ABC transporter permease [Demequina oxidasica]
MKATMRFLSSSPNVTLAIIVAMGVVLLGFKSGGEFFGPVSVTTFFRFLAIPILIGLAQMITLSVGQLNLAVGSIGGFAACLAGVVVTDFGVPQWIGALIAVVVGGLAGIVNGVLIVVTKINGFIVTLATMTILMGAQYALVGTRTISADAWPSVTQFGKSEILGIPVIFIMTLIVAGLVSFYFAKMVGGRRLLATGDNETAAEYGGISIDRSLITAHGLSGLLAGVAAFVAVATLPGVNQSVGGDWLLPSFAAPIIGGVVLTGGAVAVLGTVLAATIVRLVDSARAEFQLAPAWVNLVVGAVVLGTVALGRVRANRAEALIVQQRVRAAEEALAEVEVVR